MRNGDDRSLVLLQVLFEPVDALGVEVVRRLVEQQYVRLLQQQPAQRHAAAFAARQVFDGLVGVRTPQRVHRAFERGVQFPAVLVVDQFGQLALPFDQLRHLVVVHRLHELRIDLFVLFQQRDHVGAPFLDHFADGFRVVQLRFLFEVADRVARREDHFALEILVQPGDDLHQRRFPGAVQPDDSDFSPVEKRQVDAVQHFFLVRESLADSDHREYDFFVCHVCVLVRLICANIIKKPPFPRAFREYAVKRGTYANSFAGSRFADSMSLKYL